MLRQVNKCNVNLSFSPVNDLYQLKNKVIVVSGSTGVLGSSLVDSLAEEKAFLILLGRNNKLLQKKINELYNKTKAEYFVVDVLNKSDLERVSVKIIQKYKKIDVLINAVGGNLPGSIIEENSSIFELDENAFDDVVNLNLKGTVLPSLVFGKEMSKNKSGAILNYSSMVTDKVLTKVVGYSAAKAAMENFTKWMAVEMSRKFDGKIRVNAIAPGFFISKQNKKLLIKENGKLTERAEKIIAKTPMGRFGKPEELSEAVKFLCGDGASFITGIVLPIDGGFSSFSGV